MMRTGPDSQAKEMDQGMLIVAPPLNDQHPGRDYLHEGGANPRSGGGTMGHPSGNDPGWEGVPL